MAPISALAQAPSLAHVAPLTAVAGTQVTFIETDFGATQRSGNVWLERTYMLESSGDPGTTLDLPIKWADIRWEAKILTEQGRKL